MRLKKIIYFSILLLLICLIQSCASKKENLVMSNISSYNHSNKYYQCVGKVLSIHSEDIGKGGAAGKISATVVQVQISSSELEYAKPGSTIYCELIPSPRVNPVIGREYVFKAKHIHPAQAKGVYLLETDVLDLVN